MPTFIHSFRPANSNFETRFIMGQKRTCYNGIYPFKILPQKFTLPNGNMQTLYFSPITILYGSNGSGKSTLLNAIAEKAELTRHSVFSGGPFFKDYLEGCALSAGGIPQHSQILTSDDISDYLLNMRFLNNGIDTRRAELFEDYLDRKYKSHRFTGMADYDDWKESFDAKSKSQSQFVKDRLMRNVDTASNGETAFKYFTERITENAVYLLDEPENSLSVKLQTELAQYIFDSAKYFGCQFIIASHSPIFLAIENAKIYDLDDTPVSTKPWTELENIRVYYDFFMSHSYQFDNRT